MAEACTGLFTEAPQRRDYYAIFYAFALFLFNSGHSMDLGDAILGSLSLHFVYTTVLWANLTQKLHMLGMWSIHMLFGLAMQIKYFLYHY